MKKLIVVLMFLFSFSLGFSAVIQTDCKAEKKIERTDLLKSEFVVEQVSEVLTLDGIVEVHRQVRLKKPIVKNADTNKYFIGNLQELYKENLTLFNLSRLQYREHRTLNI